MSTKFDPSGSIPVNAAVPITTFSPVVFDVPGRPVPLEVKVSAPAHGSRLPVILLSHGHGMSNFLSSMYGYGPLADFWAEHGFVVIQPTHLDSTGLGLREESLPDSPLYWRDRATDMHFLLDHLDEIEDTVPGLAGRIDRDRIAAVGHSLGANTVSLLLGTQVLDPNDTRDKDLSDPRVKVGVIIATPGIGDDLAPWASEHYPMMKYINFDNMAGTALVIAGDEDLNTNFSERLSYRWDAHTYSPGGNKTLLTFFGGKHMLGGISGYDANETDDDDPNRMATLRALVWAYLRSQLNPDDEAWANAVTALETSENPIAKVESR